MPQGYEKKRGYVLGMLLLVYTSSYLDRQILSILFEPIKQDLGLSNTQLGLLAGLTFAIFYATLGVPIAMLADRWKRPVIIGIATIVWSGMTVLCGMANNFLQLALARIGVGIGEAGSSPPSHSIIADIYAPHERNTAMGIFSLGISLGIVFGYLIGGWANEYLGWRMAFYIVGAPGVILGILVWVTIKDPPRGMVEKRPQSTKKAPPFLAVVRHMIATPSLRNLVAGMTIAAFVGYGFILWLPSFVQRVYGLDTGITGTILALLSGVVGGAGVFGGGWLADRLSKRDIRWNSWIIAIAKIAIMPLLIVSMMVDDVVWFFILYLIPSFGGGFYIATTFSMVQGLVGLRMRSVAAALVLFVINIIGLGFGPTVIGAMNDLYLSCGASWWQVCLQEGDGLRYAMITVSLLNMWAGLHYVIAARTLKADMARVAAAE